MTEENWVTSNTTCLYIKYFMNILNYDFFFKTIVRNMEINIIVSHVDSSFGWIK